MRVHELAKKLGVETKSFIEKLNAIGIEGKTHLSGLDSDQVSTITKKLSNVVKEEKTNVVKPATEKKEEVKQDAKDHVVKEKLVFTHEKKEYKQQDNRSNNNYNNNNNYNRDNRNTNNNYNNNYNNNRDSNRTVGTTVNNTASTVNTTTNATNTASTDNRNNNYNKDNRDNNNYNRDNRPNNNHNRDNNRPAGTTGTTDNRPNNNYNRSNTGGYSRDNRPNNNYNRDNNRPAGTTGSTDNRNTSNTGGYNRDNRSTDNRSTDNRTNTGGYNRDNRSTDNRSNTGGYNRDNRSTDNRSNTGGYNRDNRSTDNRSNTGGYNRDNRSTDSRSNTGGYNRDNNNGNNTGGYNRDRNSNSGGGYNNRGTDNRGSEGGNRFNKPFNRDQKKPEAGKTDSGIAPPVEKPTKIAPKNKIKFDKKKYELEKKQREEEKKLKELRSDFRKEDKKKKGVKKKDKTIKNEITMLEGETIGTITIRDEISLKELAEKLGINVSEIIKKFFMEGKMLTANAILTFEEAEEIAIERDVLVEHEEVEEISYGEKYNLEEEDSDDELITRAPVITIMGHVDHGKTSLLDAIRHTNVIDGEAGGITQKIGAYQIKWKENRITFIDTPGHEAFTEMRARGAKVTDIAILIVAADDGVKPQTVEAIAHAKEAGVPIIVAINKIDKPGADVTRVKQELLEYGLMAPDWGGDTEFVEISAKQRLNLESLLETIVLTSELLELTANPKKRPKAVVIESRLDPQMGAVADILIQEGELAIGDIFVAGQSYGRVRSMVDDRGNKILKAGISKPVEITGFNTVPEAGDTLYGVNNDKQAKKIVEDYIKEIKINEQNKKKHISLESLSQELEDQQLKELKCIIRGDSKGSVEALKESLAKLNNEKSMVNVIQATAGAITEGDVKLAEASNAIIIGFNVRPTTPARNEAEKLGVEIRTYNIIYHVIEDIEKAMKGMLDPEFKEVYFGRIEVRQVFKITNVGNIAGAIVVDGRVTKASKIRVLRDAIIIYEGEIDSLKRFKDDAKEVFNGQDCGIAIKDFNEIKEGDIIESYILEEIPR
jgi:translation initiation factor IF-2